MWAFNFEAMSMSFTVCCWSGEAHVIWSRSHKSMNGLPGDPVIPGHRLCVLRINIIRCRPSRFRIRTEQTFNFFSRNGGLGSVEPVYRSDYVKIVGQRDYSETGS